MNGKEINPDFATLNNAETLKNGVKSIIKKNSPVKHNEILGRLIDQFQPIDFKALIFPVVEKLRKELENLSAESDEAKTIRKRLDSMKPNQRQLLISVVENVLTVAEKNNWGICKNHDFIYLFNGAFWANIDKESFQKFLGEAAEKMGVGKYVARYFQFREQLYKQFMATAYLPTPDTDLETVLINLTNGTFEINGKKPRLRPFNSSDFLTYQLPFAYDPKATAPQFQQYLDKVLPDVQRQKILAEFLGCVFIKRGGKNPKFEKALILYGTGANGKSVFFEIVNALLGTASVGNYSLQSLTNDNGYFRAKLANKLVNYASEINGKLQSDIFKQLVSGEPVEARLPYGEPFTLKHYAKLIFNCNELPKEVEHNNAYFRRFLIVPFDVTIPEAEQDKTLHSKIIDNELSGVFNWVLDGLKRLLKQKRFSESEAVKKALERYQKESDSTQMFLEENGYQSSPDNYVKIKDLYFQYRMFCIDDGFKPVNKTNFKKRLNGAKILTERNRFGNVAYLQKQA